MENKSHRFIVASYELYTVENGNTTFVEKTEESKPMSFYTGTEMVIKAFEDEIVKYNTEDNFEFTITKENAYGDHDHKNVLAFDKSMFEVNGVFDSENIKVDATIPLQNEEGQRFLGKVVEITEDKVTVDLNHPLAGKDLLFKGYILLNREADKEEVENFFTQMNSSSCGCGGGSCGSGGCGSSSCGCGDSSCGCGDDLNSDSCGCGSGSCGCNEEEGGKGCGCGSGSCGCGC